MIVVVACMSGLTARARADELGLRADLEAGFQLGGARIHDQGGMLSGGMLAAGASWHALSLVGTLEHDGFNSNDGGNPSVSLSRFGWRARYDVLLNDDELGTDGARSKTAWYLDAGTGEQLIRWDAVDSQRADFSVGTGLSILGYDSHHHGMPLGMGLDIGFEMTSAAAVPAIEPARKTLSTATAGGAAGRENSYMFTFGTRFF